MPSLNGMSPAMSPGMSPGVTGNSSDRFFSKSSYVLYLAFMAILFAFTHQKADLKRVQFAIALFVMNFVVWAVYLGALQHAPTISGVFKIMFYLTMILAPGFLLHVLIDCNFCQAASSTTEETSGDRELDVKHDVANNIPTDSHVLTIEQEDEQNSSNPAPCNEVDNMSEPQGV